MKKNVKTMILLLLSYIILMSFSYVSGLYGNKNYSSGILCLIIYIIISYIIINYLKTTKNRKKTITSILISLIISCALVYGYNLEAKDTIGIQYIATHIYIFSLTTFFYSIINMIREKSKDINSEVNKLFNFKFIDKHLFNKKTFIKCLLLILLAWFPVFLAFYPGIFSYDAPYQFTDIYLWNFRSGNPIIHTLIIGGTLNLGKILFHSYNAGVAIYSIIQAFILASTLSYVVTYLNKRKANDYLKIITLLIFMFLPTHSLLSITTTKDVMFSCFVTLFVIKNIDLLCYRDEFFNKKDITKNIILTIVYAFLILIFRPNGIYALPFYFFFLLIYYIFMQKKDLKKVLIIIVIPFLLFKAYNYGTSLLPKPKKGASFSPIYIVPIQQLGRVYNYGDLSKKEKKNLDIIYSKNKNKCAFCNYNKYIFDTIAKNKDNYTMNKNINKFKNYYAKYMIEYPVIYIDAFAYNSIAYWSIYDKYPEHSYYYKYRPYLEMYTEDRDHHTKNEIKNDTKFKFLYDKYISYIEDGRYQSIPILSLLMSCAIYNLLLICSFIVLLIYKRWKKILPLVFLMGLIGINFLGPTSLVRYCYYLFICFPLIIHLLMIKEK